MKITHVSNSPNRYRAALKAAQHPKQASSATTASNEQPPTPHEQPSATKMSNPSPAPARATHHRHRWLAIRLLQAAARSTHANGAIPNDSHRLSFPRRHTIVAIASACRTSAETLLPLATLNPHLTRHPRRHRIPAPEPNCAPRPQTRQHLHGTRHRLAPRRWLRQPLVMSRMQRERHGGADVA